MPQNIYEWWATHKGELWKCAVTVLGAVVWYAGRELMQRQRLPFVSPPQAAGFSAPED